MSHSVTTNARIQHQTLDKLRIIKKAYGFRTLFEAAEYVVQKVLRDYETVTLLEKMRLVDELTQQQESSRAKGTGN